MAQFQKLLLPSLDICTTHRHNSLFKVSLRSLLGLQAKLIYGLDWDAPTTQVLPTTNWRSLKRTYLSNVTS